MQTNGKHFKKIVKEGKTMEIVYESERLKLEVFTEDDIEPAKLFWGDSEVMEYAGDSIPDGVNS